MRTRLRIVVVTPAPPGSRAGNRVTAARWARILRGLGHRVAIATRWDRAACDLLVALHARKSHASIAAFRRAHPERPLIVALTGTDLYHDLGRIRTARRSLELATRIVTLQPRAIDAVPRPLRARARAIVQSAAAPPRRVRPAARSFDVCVLGHLRTVKDPLRAAEAARRLPATSRLRVVQIGRALEGRWARRARREAAANPRYLWRGELPRGRALAALARCHLLVVSSRLEGGANVVSEAIARGLPVVSTRIAGSIGLFGDDHPGYFPVGDTAALARLLHRAETDARFYSRLVKRSQILAPMIDPRRERRAWADLLAEIDQVHSGRAHLRSGR